jgi:hypothetical protein
MRNKTALLAGLCGAAIAAGAAVGEGIDKQDFKQIERGRYLTVAGDCAACHTLPGSGHEFAGGRNIETPFGLLIGPNITPDPQTGIGAWTDDEFVNALKNGTGRDGERLYPAMPYTYYTKIARGCARHPRLSEHAPAGVQSRPAKPAAVPLRHPHIDAGVGPAVLHAGDVSAKSKQERGMESGRVFGRGSHPLRHVPHAEECAWRRR